MSLSTPQYRFCRGLELFGDKGYQAALKELDKNLFGRGCIEVLPEANITWEIKQIALGYLMFLKRKRNRKIKGRGCVDGRPQREYILKEEYFSVGIKNYDEHSVKNKLNNKNKKHKKKVIYIEQ